MDDKQTQQRGCTRQQGAHALTAAFSCLLWSDTQLEEQLRQAPTVHIPAQQRTSNPLCYCMLAVCGVSMLCVRVGVPCSHVCGDLLVVLERLHLLCNHLLDGDFTAKHLQQLAECAVCGSTDTMGDQYHHGWELTFTRRLLVNVPSCSKDMELCTAARRVG